MTFKPTVVPIKGDGEIIPPQYDDLIAEGALAALRQVLAKKPFHVVIAYELRDGKEGYNFICFPPGEAAGRHIIKALAEAALNGGE